MTVTNITENFGEAEDLSLGISDHVAAVRRAAYQNTLCSPGLGAGASTSTKPLISAAAEMSGFCLLYIQMHCLPIYCNIGSDGCSMILPVNLTKDEGYDTHQDQHNSGTIVQHLFTDLVGKFGRHQRTDGTD